MNYKNVLFDLGNVLIDVNVRRSLHAFSLLLNTEPESTKIPASLSEMVTEDGLLGGHSSQLIDLYQVGAISTDEFVSTIQQVCKAGTAKEQIVDAWYAMLVGIQDEKKALLQTLVERKKNIYILSNINELHVDWTLSHCPELQMAKRLFFSNEMHMSKPDPRCYEQVLAETGIRAEETVYIDDLLPNIEVGQKFGFQCIHAIDNSWIKDLLA